MMGSVWLTAALQGSSWLYHPAEQTPCEAIVQNFLALKGKNPQQECRQILPWSINFLSRSQGHSEIASRSNRLKVINWKILDGTRAKTTTTTVCLSVCLSVVLLLILCPALTQTSLGPEAELQQGSLIPDLTAMETFVVHSKLSP